MTFWKELFPCSYENGWLQFTIRSIHDSNTMRYNTIYFKFHMKNKSQGCWMPNGIWVHSLYKVNYFVWNENHIIEIWSLFYVKSFILDDIMYIWFWKSLMHIFTSDITIQADPVKLSPLIKITWIIVNFGSLKTYFVIHVV